MTPAPIQTQIESLLRALVNEFIFYPADLEISVNRFTTILNVSWRGNRADTSRMIGERGATWAALHNLLELIGEQHGLTVDLERVGDPKVGKVERYEGFKANADWPRARIIGLIKRAAESAVRAGNPVEVSSGNLGATKTGIEIAIAANENMRTESVLRASLSHIFKVIGNRHGRELIVTVRRSLESERQPETASGRFVKI